MPLVRIDLNRGRPDAEVRQLADTIHEVLVEVMGIPPRDRFQIITQHGPGEILAEDAGLGFDRTDHIVMIQIFTQTGRSVALKQTVYRRIVEQLEDLGQLPNDVFISFIENTSADWSFGFGRAQFLTGELKPYSG